MREDQILLSARCAMPSNWSNVRFLTAESDNDLGKRPGHRKDEHDRP